jgi:hypothetical protein
MPAFDEETKACESPHVVILGAGASKATLPNGDISGLPLPLMNDLVETVGLNEILTAHNIHYEGKNFEELYDGLSSQNEHKSLLIEVEDKIREYFKRLQLPSHSTIYDYLVLSLRDKDLIARDWYLL